MKNKSSIWITWENQIRNKSMSARLGADFFPIIDNSPRFFRYYKSTVATVKLLYRHREKIVFVQNPSIVLSFFAVILKKIFGYKLIIDAHNSGVFPVKKLQFIANYINKNADYVIVTNQALADFINSLGGRSLILPDPLPSIDVDKSIDSHWDNVPRLSVMAICSWASDEPYVEIIGAARLLPDVTFYITGNSKGREYKSGAIIPPNVILTGYISENDYHILLRNVAVVIDLTLREDCLVCGAYEAIAVGKPLVLSDTGALREYFGGEAFFTENNAPSIAKEIKKVFDSYSDVSVQAKINSDNVERRWLKYFKEFNEEIFP